MSTMQNQQKIPLRGYIYASLVVAIWTGFVLVSRAGGISVLTSWDVIAVRYLAASAVVLPYWYFFHRVSLFTWRLVCLSLLAGLLYTAFVFASFKLAPAAHAAVILSGSQPFFALPLAWLLLGQKPSIRNVIALVIIGAGVGCLFIDVIDLSPKVVRGDLLMMVGAAIWVFYSVLLRRWQVAPKDVTIAAILISALIYFPIYWFFLPKQLALAGWGDIALQAVYQGIIASIVQMMLFVRTIGLIGPTRMGMFMAITPGLAGVLAVPLLGEPLSLLVTIGLVLACFGAWFGNRGK